MDDSPETVTEAVALLRERGYVHDCVVRDATVRLRDAETPTAAPEMEVVYRFEGDSNPDDEMIVVGVAWPGGARGVLVAAYGPDMSPSEVAVLRRLVDERH